MITVKNVKKTFDTLDVLKGIDLTVNDGDVISIIGPSGSGKTTLLRCINFLEKAEEGSITFDDVTYDFATISKNDINKIRKKTGFVFQSYNLFKNKTALQNVTEGLIVARKMNKEKANEIGKHFLDKVGLPDKYDAYPDQLSGGQQQRVAIARALAADPEIIYFDEPTSALDPELTNEVINVIRQLADEGMTMIVVTHELSFAKNISNRVIFMENGVIVEENTATEFFKNPKEERTKQFIQLMNREENNEKD